ncbi:EamA family transporter [Micromonospora sp. NPDC049301]|uniref:EamA family transporter n=1 Tax=Micromonospora sp. NPDC049301 TaxID=3155723 RepID=UPI0034255077
MNPMLVSTAVTPIVWGTTYAVTSEFLPDDRPLLAAALRALPAGLVLLAVTRALPRGAWWWKAAVLGTLNIGVFFAMLFFAAYRLPGGVAAVLGATGPLLTVGLSAALLRIRPSTIAIGAGLLGVLGVSLVVLRPDAHLDLLGILAGLVGTASMATGTVLTKRWGRPAGIGALPFTAWQLTAGGLLLAPVALAAEGLPATLTGTNLAGYGYLATAGTALAYWLWFRGIAALPATSVAFLALLSPITAAVLGWLALGQTLRPVQVVGLVVALAGTLLGQLSNGATGRAAVPVSGLVRRPVGVCANLDLAPPAATTISTARDLVCRPGAGELDCSNGERRPHGERQGVPRPGGDAIRDVVGAGDRRHTGHVDHPGRADRRR